MESKKAIHTQDLLAFLREHRGNETNYRLIHERIDTALHNGAIGSEQDGLQEVQEKYGAAYLTAREQGGTAWPEFERYVTELERCLLNGNK